jgi:hypothetical protein
LLFGKWTIIQYSLSYSLHIIIFCKNITVIIDAGIIANHIEFAANSPDISEARNIIIKRMELAIVNRKKNEIIPIIKICKSNNRSAIFYDMENILTLITL